MRRALTLMLVALWLAGPATAAEVTVQAPLRVRTFTVGASREGSVRWVPALLVAGAHATLSTRLSASVLSVAVNEGARVKKGQLLLSLSDSDLRAQLRAAQAGLSAAALQEKRIGALVAEKAATQAELDGARLQRAQAEAAVGVVQTSLQYTSIRAPFAGRLQSKRVSAGDLVSPGQPLLELEGSGFELQAALSEVELDGIAPGGRLGYEAEGRRGEAEVVALSPGGDAIGHRQLLRARIQGSLERLRSGGFARIALPQRGRDGLWVPRSALVQRGDLTGVFVAREGRAELRWLALGDAEPDSERVPVRAGLAAGDEVVEDPSAAFDGATLEVAHGP